MNNRLLIVIGITGLMATVAPNRVASSDAIPDSIIGTHIVDTEALRVRYSPNTSDRIAVVLYSGDVVQLLDTTGQWSHVAYDSNGVVRTGWTLSRLIVDKAGADNTRRSNRILSETESIVAPVARAPFESASIQTDFVSTHIVDTDALRVRYTPDKYASTTVILKFGDELQFMDSVANWSRIAYVSNSVVRTGWVLSNLIEEKPAVGHHQLQN